jgi:uncharacterized protein YbbC (DUF1343 family)/CubicO group peptidase (beta-lactamase class C family)
MRWPQSFCPPVWWLGAVVLLASWGSALAEPSGLDQSVDAARLARIDTAVEQAIARHELPGAVVLVLQRGETVYHKAFGQRSRQPTATPMTPDTVFDLASLTKPVATATSIMILMEQGMLRLTDRVSQHWPAFGQNGKDVITVEQLLLHTSGLLADNAEADYRDGKERALAHICALTPKTPPGSRFTYSDVGFIVLGELVERLGGVPLDQFAQKHIFLPLGMTATGFRPAGPLKERCAPTFQREGRWMVGEVHDPRSYLLGGVAGHAGLFSTADDLGTFARMLFGGGQLGGRRILREETVRLLTTPRPVPGGLRTLGWDAQTSYSANRGDLFPAGASFGHTGFTGTSIWLDPGTQTAVIFLSNRVHPDGKGNVTPLRRRVATLAAAAVGYRPDTLAGIDVLAREKFARLKGRRVGLVTNHTGRDRNGTSTIDLLHRADGVTLAVLFSPEHGIRGALDAPVPDARDEKTGLPIYSLYEGKRRKPTAEQLRGVDTLVYDIQDAGCRFYTYISTLGLVLEAAAEHSLRVVVLDRPNPIGGVAVEGPVLDAGRESFVGYHRLPVRYGMTIGELARLYNAERKIGADLDVVPLQNWRRDAFYDRTNLAWVNPSPNLRSLTEAFLYPGIGLLETTNVSVGRGTDRPFEWVGAPWLDGRRLAAALTAERLPGVRFVPLRLTPTASVHKGQDCGGVQLIVDDWARFQPVRTGLAIACALRRLYPDAWQIDRYDRLLAHKATWEGVRRGADWRDLEQAWQADLDAFRNVRRRYLLYPEPGAD